MTQISKKPTPSRPPIPSPLLPLLRPEYRTRVGTGLLAGAAGFAVMVLVLLIRSGLTNFPVTVWGFALVLVLTATGAWAHLAEPRTPEEGANQMRLLALTVGGGVGFATAVLGLAMPIFMYSPVFAGGLEVWRQNWWRVMLCALALFGGLVLMLLSLLLGRTAERTSPGIRRLLYGYNTALTGLLLLAILTVVNVLADVRIGPLGFFSKPWDWTDSGIYSLSTATEDFLKHLDKPVKIYVRMPEGHPVTRDTETLLDNMRGLTDKISWTFVSREQNRRELQALIEKYQLSGSYGLLVVYGTEPGELFEFIPGEQLFSDTSIATSTDKEAKRRFLYKGEGVLMKTLTFLAEGKKKAVIYFTQGNGEPDLSSAQGGDRFSASLAELRDRLSGRNYEVKELKLTPGVDKVPTDAEVVVVANPRTGLPGNAVKALTNYMNPTGSQPKGKMIYLADVVVKGDRSGMVPSGLEGMLARFNVRVGNERLLVPRRDGDPTRIQVMPNLRSRNPIARGFVTADGYKLFTFEDARPVEPLPSNPRAPAPYKTETILRTYQPVWKESNLRDPVALVQELATPDRQDEVIAKLRATGGPVSVAVAVTESTSTLPNIPQHRNVGGGEDKPRLVVFGDSTWITDEGLAGPASRYHVDLFASCLAWLRQRQGIGTDVKEGKDRKEFTLAGTANPDMVSRLRWTPVGLMLLAIVGLGGTIWLVRRR
jgi:gliding motility-associatede transport system auxiliary component